MRLRRSNFWNTSTFKKIRSLGSTEKLENKKQAGALDVSVDPRESRAVPALDFPVASFVGLSPGGPVPGSAALQPAVPVTERVLGLAGSESRWSERRIDRPVVRHRAGTPAGDDHGKSRSHSGSGFSGGRTDSSRGRPADHIFGPLSSPPTSLPADGKAVSQGQWSGGGHACHLWFPSGRSRSAPLRRHPPIWSGSVRAREKFGANMRQERACYLATPWHNRRLP